MSARQPLGSTSNNNNGHPHRVQPQGLTFANHGSTAKTRTELLEVGVCLTSEPTG